MNQHFAERIPFFFFVKNIKYFHTQKARHLLCMVVEALYYLRLVNLEDSFKLRFVVAVCVVKFNFSENIFRQVYQSAFTIHP